MELLTADQSRRGLKAPAQRTGAPPWGLQRRGELEEVSLPPTLASLLGAGQGQLPRGREPRGAPGNLVGLGRLSSGTWELWRQWDSRAEIPDREEARDGEGAYGAELGLWQFHGAREELRAWQEEQP